MPANLRTIYQPLKTEFAVDNAEPSVGVATPTQLPNNKNQPPESKPVAAAQKEPSATLPDMSTKEKYKVGAYPTPTPMFPAIDDQLQQEI